MNFLKLLVLKVSLFCDYFLLLSLSVKSSLRKRESVLLTKDFEFLCVCMRYTRESLEAVVSLL